MSLKCVRISDRTACTCTVIDGSPNVFVNGLRNGRPGDPVVGHGDWIPNNIESGSGDIFDNSIASTRITDWHVGHPKRSGGEFHKTQYVTGSPDTYVN